MDLGEHVSVEEAVVANRAEAHLEISRGSQGGCPMAMISSVESSVYRPSTSANEPSVNNPSPGSSYSSSCQILVKMLIQVTDKLPKIQHDRSVRVFDAQVSLLGRPQHAQKQKPFPESSKKLLR